MNAQSTPPTSPDDLGIDEVLASFCYYLRESTPTTVELADTVVVGVIFRPFRITKYRAMPLNTYAHILDHDTELDPDPEFADHIQQCHHYTVYVINRVLASGF